MTLPRNFFKQKFDKPITINKDKPKSPFARPIWFTNEDIKVISKYSGNRIKNSAVTNGNLVKQ